MRSVAKARIQLCNFAHHSQFVLLSHFSHGCKVFVCFTAGVRAQQAHRGLFSTSSLSGPWTEPTHPPPTPSVPVPVPTTVQAPAEKKGSPSCPIYFGKLFHSKVPHSATPPNKQSRGVDGGEHRHRPPPSLCAGPFFCLAERIHWPPIRLRKLLALPFIPSLVKKRRIRYLHAFPNVLPVCAKKTARSVWTGPCRSPQGALGRGAEIGASASTAALAGPSLSLSLCVVVVVVIVVVVVVDVDCPFFEHRFLNGCGCSKARAVSRFFSSLLLFFFWETRQKDSLVSGPPNTWPLFIAFSDDHRIRERKKDV